MESDYAYNGSVRTEIDIGECSVCGGGWLDRFCCVIYDFTQVCECTHNRYIICVYFYIYIINTCRIYGNVVCTVCVLV